MRLLEGGAKLQDGCNETWKEVYGGRERTVLEKPMEKLVSKSSSGGEKMGHMRG